MSDEVVTNTVELKSNAVPSVFAQPTQEAPKDSEPKAEAEEHDQEESEEASAASDGDDSTAHPKKNRGVGKRINELTREKHEALRRAEALEKELAQYKSKPVETPKPVQGSDARPTLADFDYDYEAHAEAVADWKVRQAFAERERKEAESKDQQYREGRAKDLQARIDAYAEREPEAWAEAIAAPVKLTQSMMEAIADSELAPEIGVYLARNLDESESISRMGPAAQIRAIGRIEAKLESAQKDTQVAPPKKLTNAPPPAKTLKGGNAAIKNVDAENISTADRIAIWRAQKSSR